jgi:hypothetical protein
LKSFGTNGIPRNSIYQKHSGNFEIKRTMQCNFEIVFSLTLIRLQFYK